MTEGQVSPEPLLGVAAEYATERVPVARPDDEAGAVRAALQARSFDSVHDVVVLEGESFVGVVPARRLLAAEPGTPLARLMEPDPSVVRPAERRDHGDEAHALAAGVRSGRMAHDGRPSSGSTIGKPVRMNLSGGGPPHWLIVVGSTGHFRAM